MPSFPRQIDGLDIATVEEGLVVNDHVHDRVHYLNHTAGLVLTLCDGKNSIETIAALLQMQFDLASPPEDDVSEAIEEFVEEGLVILRTE